MANSESIPGWQLPLPEKRNPDGIWLVSGSAVETSTLWSLAAVAGFHPSNVNLDLCVTASMTAFDRHHSSLCVEDPCQIRSLKGRLCRRLRQHRSIKRDRLWHSVATDVKAHRARPRRKCDLRRSRG